MLKSAVYFDFEEADEFHKGKGLDGQDIYLCYAEIDGEKYVVKFKIDVFNNNKGMGYKTHAVYNIEDVEFTPIKKEETLGTREFIGETDYPDLTASSKISLAQAVSVVNNKGLFEILWFDCSGIVV